MIVHLNGWPGVGKLTIGRDLAQRLAGRLVHNHLLHDVAIVCTGLSDPARWPLYETVRASAYAALLNVPHAEVIVMTNALCDGSRREIEAWDHVVDLAVGRGVPLVPIVLVADLDESIRRLASPERLGRKLTDTALLRSFVASDTIQHPDVPETLVLDVTCLAPAEAAAAIVGHLTRMQATAGALRPATDAHRRLRRQAAPSGR